MNSFLVPYRRMLTAETAKLSFFWSHYAAQCGQPLLLITCMRLYSFLDCYATLLITHVVDSEVEHFFAFPDFFEDPKTPYDLFSRPS
jgi:hypothetical protein